MRTRLLLLASLALAGLGAPAEPAIAKGLPYATARGGDGVTAPGSEYRYVTLSPTSSGDTVIAQIDRNGGRVSRWWPLNGTFDVPAVALDGSTGGLSADGGTLVLSEPARAFWPKKSRFAIIEPPTTERRAGARRSDRFASFITLRGSFSFDAISPDGSTVYLIRYLTPGDPTHYQVRAFDTEGERLITKPIVDPSEPDEQMRGVPLSRAISPDGRWAYTLYDGMGHEPFVHALDTVGRKAVCVDMPQLAGRRGLSRMSLQTERAGRELAVLDGTDKAVLLTDTRTFEVKEPAVDQGSVAQGSDSSRPSLLLLGGASVLALALAAGLRRVRGR